MLMQNLYLQMLLCLRLVHPNLKYCDYKFVGIHLRNLVQGLLFHPILRLQRLQLLQSF